MPYGLQCGEKCPRGQNCDRWGVEGTEYKHEGADLMGKAWERCPVSYLNNSHLLIALDILGCNKVAPLSDWPFGFSAWVVKYLTSINNAIEDRKANEVNNGIRRG